MSESTSYISFIAALFIFFATSIKIVLLYIAFRLLSNIYPFIFPSIGITPWWIYVLYFFILLSGTMFIYTLLVEKKHNENKGKVLKKIHLNN